MPPATVLKPATARHHQLSLSSLTLSIPLSIKTTQPPLRLINPRASSHCTRARHCQASPASSSPIPLTTKTNHLFCPFTTNAGHSWPNYQATAPIASKLLSSSAKPIETPKHQLEARCYVNTDHNEDHTWQKPKEYKR